MAEKVYKTSKKYGCKYCSEKFTRPDLIDHIEKKHPEMIPEGYTAARLVYEIVNKKDHGICMICKKPVYEWDEKLCRYKNLCDNPKCREQVRQNALNNHIKVYNKPTLLGDPEHQEKMLANRRISGTYKFQDGTPMTYTGQYERKTLEFMDQVLNIPAKDIQSPGPTFEYDFNGEKHFWITDIYYIPANLVIEVKDGGDNPNKREMPEYRAKVVAKEEMITANGTYNYLRLTNNNFLQLLEILAEIKYDAINGETKVRINVNEATPLGGINPVVGPDVNDMYVVPYMIQNTFDDSETIDLGFSSSFMDEYCIVWEDNKLVTKYISEIAPRIYNEITTSVSNYHTNVYKYKGDASDRVKTILEYTRTKKSLKKEEYYKILFGHRPYIPFMEITMSNDFIPVYSSIRKNLIIEYSVRFNALVDKDNRGIITEDTNFTEASKITLYNDPKGYYLYIEDGENSIVSPHNKDKYFLLREIKPIMIDIYNERYGK